VKGPHTVAKSTYIFIGVKGLQSSKQIKRPMEMKGTTEVIKAHVDYATTLSQALLLARAF